MLDPDADPNEILLQERNWLANLLTFRTFRLEIGDVGLGSGQADIAYVRDGRRWELTLRAADDD